MNAPLFIYNSLTGAKEVFTPLHPGYVGMYVCGPTVYSDVHLGNCRTFVSFDLVFRYLQYLGYKVRYVRNVTDVGHLEDDQDTGAEDKIGKKARLEQIEPMEIVQRYTNGFHDMMRVFNTLPPSIEPRATGHIMEQIEMVREIINRGYGYEVNGSVYFDTPRFIKDHPDLYGKLSGKKVDDLISESRELKKQDEKRTNLDFAIWIKADPSHLMRWKAPWSEGFPGWHLECSAMSTKYLGQTFDIHGGGSDLKFPHHENEIAQNFGACGCAPARYWMHGNMLLLNGAKMSKSKGNSISPTELFSGNSPHITKGYSPMVVRFFMLQCHYRSTLDLSDEALQAAEKGYQRMMEANKVLQSLAHPGNGTAGKLDEEIRAGIEAVNREMSDDFNTPKALAQLFELVTKINSIKGGQLTLSDIAPETLQALKQTFEDYLFKIFGLLDESDAQGAQKLEEVMSLVIQLRKAARDNKDWATSDRIRDSFKEIGIQFKDDKEGGTSWSLQ